MSIKQYEMENGHKVIVIDNVMGWVDDDQLEMIIEQIIQTEIDD